MVYSRVLKFAYLLTINHPRLWFFGLLLVGGFNAILLHILGVVSSGSDVRTAFVGWFDIQTQFGLIVLAVVTVVVGIVVSNVVRILVISTVLRTIRADKTMTDSLQLQWLQELPEFGDEQATPTKAIIKRSIAASIVASVCANIFLFVALAVVASPQLLFAAYGARISLVSLLLFLPLAFIGLCINLFPPLFSIIFGRSVSDCFRLAYDTLLKKWQDVLGFMVVLLVIYCVGFSVVFTVSQYAQSAVQYVLEIFTHLGFLPVSAIISPVRIAGGAVSWLLLAVLNVFSNIAVLLLFLHLVNPGKAERPAGFAKTYGIPQHVGSK